MTLSQSIPSEKSGSVPSLTTVDEVVFESYAQDQTSKEQVLPATSALERARITNQISYISTADFASISSIDVSTTSSLRDSPIMAPTIGGSSMVPSPKPLRGRELSTIGLSTYQLPEALLSHKLSSTSLQQATSPTGQHNSTSGGAAVQESGKSNGNLIRRLSNRASRAIRRRPSSAHPKSREGSVGPGILRRRSDSNTASVSDVMECQTFFDSDSMYDTDRDDGASTAASTLGSIANTSTSPTANVSGGVFANMIPPLPVQIGPVIPVALLHGVHIRKVSKKNSNKRLVLALDVDGGRIVWNKPRTKHIYIDDIKEIRTGSDIRQYRLDCNVAEADEPLFFSILYTVPDTTQTKLMHLVADTVDSFNDWTTTLDGIYKHRQSSMAMLMSFNDKALRNYWSSEVAKSSDKLSTSSLIAAPGEIDLAGVERVCRHLHIHVPQDTIRDKFHEADVSHCGYLNFSGFQEFVRLMKRRNDVLAVYRAIATNAERGISRDEFFDFLRNTQGENVDDDLASWEAVFARFARRSKTVTTDILDLQQCENDDCLRMTEAGLTAYLTSPYNLATMKEPKNFVLDRPMNEYYISSSHNTYLVGRQLAGTSSVEGYISALTRGCRCVEVDCWDGADGQPTVVHGKTWTSSISFREVIVCINKYAFAKSPFPLWISLEVHCNPEQQKIMARTMREVFGSALVTEPLPTANNRLPSPSELMHRILIKTKKTQRPIAFPSFPQQSASDIIAAASYSIGPSEFGGRRRGNSLPSPFHKPLALDGIAPAALAPSTQAFPFVHSPGASQLPSPLSYTGQSTAPVNHGHSTPTTPSRKASLPKPRIAPINSIVEGEVHREMQSREIQRDAASSSNTSDSDSSNEKAPIKAKQSKIVPELGCLAVYCVGVHKSTPFDSPDCKLFNHILSWDETVYDKFTKTREYRRAVSWHNMHYMMRVYPKAYRIGSSNFNPLVHWRRGVQMAALNWQTNDLGMQLNTAMFTGGTDQSGYVLKPREFRGHYVLPNLPGETKPRELKRERKNVSFSIGVVSAQQLMRPTNFPERRTLDPYVEVEVFLPDDKRDREETRQREFLPSTPLVYRTRIAPENGFNPNYDQRFNFHFTTKYPDLVFVRMSVKLADGGRYTNSNPTATFTAKLSNLKQGYRTIPLMDVNADRYMFSTLFCEIHKKPITSVFVPLTADAPESTNKLKSIRTVFNRSSNMSPKSSIDSGAT